MDHIAYLHQKERKQGSYYRSAFIGDVLYYSYHYQDVQITFAKKGRKTSTIVDETLNALLENKTISEAEAIAYQKGIAELITLDNIHEYDSFSIEEFYRLVVNLRKDVIGQDALSRYWRSTAIDSTPLSFENCLNQSGRISELCEEKGHVIVALTDPVLFGTMGEVLGKLPQKKKIYWILSDEGKHLLPSREMLPALSLPSVKYLSLQKDGGIADPSLCKAIADKDACILVFGESGLLDARNLVLPCGVFAKPRGFLASAVSGQLGAKKPVAVYIPDGYDVTKTVPITRKTILSYFQLAKLQKRYGDEVYSRSPESLYARFPEEFFSIYDQNTDKNASQSNLVFGIETKADVIPLKEYEVLRTRAIHRYLEGFEHCRYFEQLFTEDTTEGIQGNILVHGFRIKGCDQARVVPCGKNRSLREQLSKESRGESALVSNFLFFLTPKLANLYNQLREDRKEEQAQVNAGHLDYLLEYRDGKRTETFPLFYKTCIGMKSSGEFIFFRFRLGGGKLRFGDETISWSKEQVDPVKTNSKVCIFTPHSSCADKAAVRETYRMAVGDGRFNFVIIQDRVILARCGDVILPGMGVVVSLEKEFGLSLCKKLGLISLANGYYDSSALSFDLRLDAPSQIKEKEWEQMKWAYGGGLSLISNGVGLCDGDHMEAWFDQDGWTSPLSRQTQESALHTLAKHPRTAVGTTDEGELVVLVFSGRTEFSCGADYAEMCLIARKLIPNIQNLMNVDGGGSAVLGMMHGGIFTELSLPSTSTGSTVGMARPINTALFVPLKKKN